MKAFACPQCGQLVFFENRACLRCRSRLGFDPDRRGMVLVTGSDVRRCANEGRAGCNWVLPGLESGGETPQWCRSCQLTRTRPNDADLEDARVAQRLVRAEAAKRRLVFQLLELELPMDGGPRFDFLVDKGRPITIGHDDGLITIDLAESDDAYRERLRDELGEPYRTMVGHLRHEVGHYYWQVLVDGNDEVLGQFRSLFGDERAEYQQALEHHYKDGPPSGWAEHHVSAYAAAHPWEDWAETWAHYLHIRDTLQTAASHGVIVTGPRGLRAPGQRPVDRRLESSLMASPSLDSQSDIDEILADWLPLTYALNAINRSMGKDDLYPFVLSPKVIEKLGFVHRRLLAEAPAGSGQH